jgi:hypothetical protein
LPTAVLTELTITASRIILLESIRRSLVAGNYIGCTKAEKATARITPRCRGQTK